MSASNNARFNAEAAAWDSNPDVHVASEKASVVILKEVPQLHDSTQDEKQSIDVLEIGCGTGLLSLRIAPHVSTLLAVDAAQGMIDALQIKLRTDQDAPTNITPLCIMLTDPEDSHLPPATKGDTQTGDRHPRLKFDLVLSHLVLHHIADLRSLLRTMYGCLKSGGMIALTDYENIGPESRAFHPEAKMAGVERHGIDRDAFTKMIESTGFTDIKVVEGFRMRKHVERFPGEWGQQKPDTKSFDFAEQDFPFLLATARKP